MDVGADMKWLLHFGSNYFIARFVVTDHRVVVHREFLATNLVFKNLRAFFNFVSENNLIGLSKQLQHSQEFSIWGHIRLNRVIHPGAEHLL